MKTAIILAGGKGERLRPLTEDRPKAMVELLGTPIMAYQIHWLASYGFNRVIISCGHRHEIIQSYFGDGGKWNLQITYEVEDEPLGRGGALKQALRHVDQADGPVLSINGDGISNCNIDELLNYHNQHMPLATLVTVPLRSPYGIVELDSDDTVTAFTEKPELPYGVNAGIYVLDPRIFEFLPDKGDHELTTFPKLAQSGKLKGFRSKCFWRTVDTIKDLGELRSELERIFLDSFFKPADTSSKRGNAI
jgi:NDP-sugar pyrophosphorylase family protein